MAYFKVLSWYLPGVTEDSHENLGQYKLVSRLRFELEPS
jgi:hypothetical protein